MGSVPFSSTYFTTRRFSNTLFETGERTGSSGTSLQTAEGRRRQRWAVLYTKRLRQRQELTRANERHFHHVVGRGLERVIETPGTEVDGSKLTAEQGAASSSPLVSLACMPQGLLFSIDRKAALR